MGKFWTIGFSWGLLAWVPYFLEWSLIIKMTLGLPVYFTGYLIVLLEGIIGTVSSEIGFSLSMGTGVLFSWLIWKVRNLGKRIENRVKKEVI